MPPTLTLLSPYSHTYSHTPRTPQRGRVPSPALSRPCGFPARVHPLALTPLPPLRGYLVESEVSRADLQHASERRYVVP